MADDRYRWLLGRIALGLPLVAGPLLLPGCWGSGVGCGDPERETIVVTPDAGAVDCYAACPGGTAEGKSLESCVSLDGGAGFECTYAWLCRGGRHPDDPSQAWITRTSDPRTCWLLELAAAEAASVPAFHALAAALAHHGAPAELAARASESAKDEERHTRIALELAGEGAVRVRVAAPTVPTLEALARSNAREGCVREAFGALEAAHQSVHADDPQVRAAFAHIARDEARHALLSKDIDAWARSRVGDALVDAARHDALGALRESFAERARPAGLGLPSAAHAEALLALIA